MTDRAYTIDELDDLRAAVRDRCLYGTTDMSTASFMSRSYKEHELIFQVEAVVRTHMQAGHIAKDIRDADLARSQRRSK